MGGYHPLSGTLWRRGWISTPGVISTPCAYMALGNRCMDVDTSYLVPVQCASEASTRLQIRHFSAHISSSLTNGLHSRTLLQMKADEVELVLRHNWHCPLAQQPARQHRTSSLLPTMVPPPANKAPVTESIHPPCCDCGHLPRGLTSPPFIQPPHHSSCHCLTN